MGKAPDHENLRIYLEKQTQEALGDKNRYFTAQALQREPTDEECIRYYIEHGGAENFAQRHQRDLIKKSDG